MPIEEDLLKSLIGILLGLIVNELYKYRERIRELEVKIDIIISKIDSTNNKIDSACDKIDDTDNNSELSRIREKLFELRGMITVLTNYQRLIRPPPGG